MIPRAVAMLAALLGGVLATASLAAPAFAEAAAPSAVGATVGLTIDTDQGPRSIQDPRHAVMYHLEGETGIAVVTVSIDPEVTSFYGFLGRLEAPDAPSGMFTDECASTTITVTDVFRCSFIVPIQLGINRIDFDLKAFGIDRSRVHGAFYGVEFGAEVAFQSQQEDGTWVDFPDGDELVLPGAHSTGLRYAVRNLGHLPFRAEGSCSDAMIAPADELVCVVRGPRPVLALVGEYRLPLEIRDLTGSVVVMDVLAKVRAGTAPEAAGLATAGYPRTATEAAGSTGSTGSTDPGSQDTVLGVPVGVATSSAPSITMILGAAALIALLGVVAFWVVRQTGRSSSTIASTSGSSIRSSGSIVGGGEGSSSSSGTSRSSSRFGS